jgi:WhiB family redox-sensing transcriptional regulator
VFISIIGEYVLNSDWQEKAACRGPRATLFYAPVQGERKGIRVSRERQAKAVCNACTVRGECLSYAIKHGERHGVWGGLNESERAALLVP